MTPVQRAEMAVLGAAVLRPRDLVVVSWLRPEDFDDPWHREVLTVMRELTQLDSAAVELAVRLRERLGARRSDVARIASLVQSTPLSLDIAVYGRFVLEASLRRQVVQQGIILRAGALRVSQTRTRTPLVVAAQIVDRHVAGWHRRWAAAQGGAPITDPVVSGTDEGVLLASDRYLAGAPAIDPVSVSEREAMLVGALVDRPDMAPQISASLRPEHLLSKEWTAAYAALLDVVRSGQPVDVVTVAWRINQASPQRGSGPAPTELDRILDAAAATDPMWAAINVAIDVVRRTAESASDSLTAASANPGLQVEDLLDTTRTLTGALVASAAALPAREHRSAHPSLVPQIAHDGSGRAAAI